MSKSYSKDVDPARTAFVEDFQRRIRHTLETKGWRGVLPVVSALVLMKLLIISLGKLED